MSRRTKHNTRFTEGGRITSEKNGVATINYNLLVSKNVGVGYIIRGGKIGGSHAYTRARKKKHDQEDW